MRPCVSRRDGLDGLGSRVRGTGVRQRQNVPAEGMLAEHMWMLLYTISNPLGRSNQITENAQEDC